MLKIKMACGFAVMACAVAAFASPSFAFKEFTGKQGKVVKSSEQVLTVNAVEFRCASVAGSAEKRSTDQIKIAFAYRNCFLGGTAATFINCNFNFHINGSFTIIIECEITAGTCVFRMEESENKERKEVLYTSLGTEKSELKVNASGIKGAGGICTGNTKAATYKGTIDIEGIGVA